MYVSTKQAFEQTEVEKKKRSLAIAMPFSSFSVFWGVFFCQKSCFIIKKLFLMIYQPTTWLSMFFSVLPKAQNWKLIWQRICYPLIYPSLLQQWNQYFDLSSCLAPGKFPQPGQCSIVKFRMVEKSAFLFVKWEKYDFNNKHGKGNAEWWLAHSVRPF